MKSNNQFCRDDGFNPSTKCDDPIQRKWIHKQVVKKTGNTEDDFIIEEKPVLIEEINIQKSIDEEAKTTDLKYLLKQLLLTGDDSILNKKQGFYGDITGVQALQNGSEFVSAEVIKQSLPVELKSLSAEQLASMSDEEIINYVNEFRKSVADAAKVSGENNPPEKEG